MYIPTLDNLIDATEEKTAIVKYCQKHWTVKDNTEVFQQFVEFLFNYGAQLAGNSFTSREVGLSIREHIKKERENVKGTSSNQVIESYYAKSNITFSIDDVDSFITSHHERDEDRAYTRYMPKLLKFVREEFSAIKNVKPIGWRKYLNDPDSFEGAEYEHYDDFDGAKTDGQGYIHQHFPEALCLDTLVYNKERDRNTFESLVSAIMLHGYTTKIHNNTVNVIQELNTLFNDNTKSFDIAKIMPTIENPIVKTFFELSTYNEKKHGDEKQFKASVISPLIVEQPVLEDIFKEIIKTKNTKVSKKKPT